MSGRKLYLDEAPGERRGVVTLAGAPERLLVERGGDSYPRLGDRYAARVLRVEKGTGLASLDLGEAGRGALRLKADRAPPVEGQMLEVSVSIEPQGNKAAVLHAAGPADGPVRRLGDSLSLEDRLRAFAPDATLLGGREARAMADEAQAAALAVEHPLPGGGSIAIEQTRALTAIDVDLGSGAGRDPKRAARQANMAALSEAARLLRLKALGGLVVIDLVGRGHDGTALTRAAQAAFGADQPGVVIGPVTKFGTLDLALPRRWRPLADTLSQPGGGANTATLGLQLLRAIEREGRADPGGRLLARADPESAAAAQALANILAERIGLRFEIVSDPTRPRGAFEVSTR
jgi:Ribonuclease G/E